MIFNDISSAGNATIGIDLLDYAQFRDSSSAGSAIIHVVNNGLLEFFNSSTGGNAQVTTDAGGNTTFSNSSGPAGDNKLTVGSIAGAGTYSLGGDQLAVGSNGLPTEVSGLIDGPGGSLVKVGKGTLELSHADNTYSGGTTLNLGIVDLDAVDAAGTGDVKFAAKSHATLKIENTALSGHTFGNSIDHFGEHDAIDLSGLHFTAGATATYDRTTHHLRIHSGHVTDTLTLTSPQGTDFTVASDGHAGTLIFV
jgi:fibronectin-binding autotransporter adhesin